MVDETTHNNSDGNDIAIAAMAAHLPGACSLPLYQSELYDKAWPVTKLCHAELHAVQAHHGMMANHKPAAPHQNQTHAKRIAMRARRQGIAS